MKTNSNLLGIVVLFWNDSDKTIQCLNSLFDQKKQASSIILVDNDSDETYSKKIFNYLEKKKSVSLKYKKIL